MASWPDQAWKGARTEACKNNVGPDGAWMVPKKKYTGIYKAFILPKRIFKKLNLGMSIYVE